MPGGHPAGRSLRWRASRPDAADDSEGDGDARIDGNDDAAFDHIADDVVAAPGLEPPRDVAEAIPTVERAFAFVDLCGFTAFIATHGEYAAVDTISRFRALTRDLAVRRGVRVAKWLGDGAMIIGVDVGPTIATAAELIARYDGRPLALRGGVAHGDVLIVDGDDYIGKPVNLASRLCQAAHPGELLAVGYSEAVLPSWVTVRSTKNLTLRGLGRLRSVQRLAVADEVELPALLPPTTTTLH